MEGPMFYKDKSRLTSLQIELTNRCNERCVHCYIPHEKKITHIESALVYSIIAQCRSIGLQTITFSGGEPMLHTGFAGFLDAANWNHLKINVFSNLTLLDESIAFKLKTCNVKVQVSLYSIDAGIHDSITGVRGSCEKTKQGIEILAKYGIEIFISCPLMKQNKDSYPGVLAFANGYNAAIAPDVMIFADSSGGMTNLVHRLSVDEAMDVIRYILENDTAYNHERFLPSYRNIDDALPCVQNIGKGMVCVNAKGEILPLPAWNLVLGDIAAQTLRDIWENSTELKKIRAISLDNFPKCRSCPDIQFCGMSLGGNANENPEGNPFIIPDHVCILARRMRELVHYWYGKNNASMEALHAL
jgi:radical SAM protein with 4Fe4S-binding SPASM domain